MNLNQILIAFGVSVLASIFAVFALLVLRALRNYIIDKYGHKLAFAHISDVSGEWQSENNDHQENRMVELMSIRQLGSKIWGAIQYTVHYKNGKVSHKNFRIEGVVRNDLISFYYYNSNRRQKGIGASLLQLSYDGDRMNGKTIWWDVETNCMECSDKEEFSVWMR